MGFTARKSLMIKGDVIMDSTPSVVNVPYLSGYLGPNVRLPTSKANWAVRAVTLKNDDIKGTFRGVYE